MCFRDVAGNTWKLSQLNQVPQLACGLTTTHELHYTKHFDPASGHSECMYVLDALIDARDYICSQQSAVGLELGSSISIGYLI